MMMRKLAIAVLLVLVGCSSGMPKLEKRTMEGGPGSPIEVQLIGSSQPMMMFARGGDMPQQINFQFEVSNNSDEAVTVQRIQVYQKGSAPVQLESAQGGFDTTIEPGHDANFTVNGRVTQTRAARQGDESSIVIRADVALTNGDSYVYTFSVPIGLAVQ